MKKETQWTDVLKKLPGWITGAISFVTAVIGFILLIRGNYQLSILVIVLLALCALFFIFVYIAFAKTPPLIEGGKGVYRYFKYRSGAFWGMGIVIVLFFALFLIVLSSEAPAYSEITNEAPLSISGACFDGFFQGIPEERIIKMEVGADLTLVGSYQTKGEIIGIQYTVMNQTIGAIRILPIPDNDIFKIEEIVDEQCQSIVEYENITQGGDKNTVQNADTVKMKLNSEYYILRITFHKGSGEIRANFNQFTP